MGNIGIFDRYRPIKNTRREPAPLQVLLGVGSNDLHLRHAEQYDGPKSRNVGGRRRRSFGRRRRGGGAASDGGGGRATTAQLRTVAAAVAGFTVRGFEH